MIANGLIHYFCAKCREKMADHNERGRRGEDIAAFYLQDKGYCIRERNWRSGKLELDLVAEKDGELVFVEVKTRHDGLYGDPSEAVDRRKRRHILLAADAYVRLAASDLPVRFDVVSVLYDGTRWQIEHYEDAFSPGLTSL